MLQKGQEIPTTAEKNVGMTGECERNRRTNTTFEEKQVNLERKKKEKRGCVLTKFVRKLKHSENGKMGGND